MSEATTPKVELDQEAMLVQFKELTDLVGDIVRKFAAADMVPPMPFRIMTIGYLLFSIPYDNIDKEIIASLEERSKELADFVSILFLLTQEEKKQKLAKAAPAGSA